MAAASSSSAVSRRLSEFLGVALFARGRYDEGVDSCRRALALSPQFPDAYLERGTLKATKGDYEGARRDWNKVRELAPGSFVAGLADKNLAMLKELSGTSAPAQPARPTKPLAKP